MSTPTSPIIVALDVPSLQHATNLMDKLDPKKHRVKIGLELFVAEGPPVVHEAIKRGFEVFLDLKFKDIPKTVARASNSAALHGVWMINMHSDAGEKAMRDAVALLSKFKQRPLLIAVTVLTSLDKEDLRKIGIDENLTTKELVLKRASLAYECGLDGVVCSAQDVAMLREAILDEKFILVVPGSRSPGADLGEQKRSGTPAGVMKEGGENTFLVIGSEATAEKEKDPAAVLARIVNDISEGK